MYPTIAERLLLIALDDEKGSDTTAYGIDHGLAGAILLDLAAAEAVEVVDGKVVASGPEPADPLLRDAHRAIRADEKRRDAKGWVRQLQKDLTPIKERVAGRLIDQGILSEKEHRTLGLFKSKRFPEADPTTERELRARLEDILTSRAEPEPDDALLIALLKVYNLPRKLVPKDQRRAAKKRADEIADKGIAGDAVAKALQDIEAAVIVTVLAASVTTTASN